MTQKKLKVTTGSRLHFGLFSVGQIQDKPQFGGCGLMIQGPANRIIVHSDGITDERLVRFAERWKLKIEQAYGDNGIPWDRFPSLTLAENAASHSGFGSGTQLAMAVGLALCKWFELALCDANQLSSIMERGLRSAIGTHGFFHGGFLVDRGKRQDDQLAELDFNIDFPSHWPILVLILKSALGIHGPEEVAAFRDIPVSTESHRDRMIEMVKNQIAPAIAKGNYGEFGDALFEYGRSSGSAYATIQGGDFHSRPIEELVYQIRNFGVSAVGQSSWGPCVFAIAENDSMANRLSEELQNQYGASLEIKKTFSRNQGAEIKWLDSE